MKSRMQISRLLCPKDAKEDSANTVWGLSETISHMIFKSYEISRPFHFMFYEEIL